MPNDYSNLIEQLKRAINLYNNMRRQVDFEDLSGGRYSNAERQEMLNILISTIQRVTPKASSYWSQYQALVRARDGSLGTHDMSTLVGIIAALRRDLSEGFVQEFEELIHAEVFGDFLEMAEHLLEAGYKDSSAVMIGGVLEEHLRKLAIKNGISIANPSGAAKKADALNNELATAGAYNKLEQKNITAWLDLRNKAAHGLYGEYIKEQVAALLSGVRSFISRFQA